MKAQECIMVFKFIVLSTALGIWSCTNMNASKEAESHKSQAVDTLPMSDCSKDFLMGKFDPKERKDFVEIPLGQADREGLLMHEDAYVAFERMHEAALADGIELVIRSATRNFDYQKGIWERKWKKYEEEFPDPEERALHILKWSSMPGSSRHHWGTDVDFNSFENSYFESGEGKKVFDWLEENAPQHGFERPYTQKGDTRPWGYNEEKWHWSYTPISSHLTKMAQDSLTDRDIKGFLGADQAAAIGVVEKYILGIDGRLK